MNTRRGESTGTAAGDALRASSLVYEQIISSAREGIIVFDRELRYVVWNPFMEEFTGVAASELLGRHTAEVFPELRDLGIVNAQRRSLQGELVDLPDVPVRSSRTGEQRWFSIKYVPLRGSRGQIDGVISMVRDVTARKHAEDEILRLNADLEKRVVERTAELEAFTYSVSHDLRAPLRHISGHAGRLAERKAQLDEQSRHHLANIARCISRMEQLIEDLLAFSRIGQTQLQKTPVDLRELVHDVRQEVSAETQDRDIEWLIGPLPQVRGDRSLLRQAMVNMLSNAVKFTRARAHARIEVGSVPEQQSGNETVLLIRDNGVGFDMQNADKLFGVFQRLHSAADFEGTGIGLANVQRIIQRHGGRIWVEAAVDAGATFYIALPQ